MAKQTENYLELLKYGVSEEIFPGAVALVFDRGKVIFHEAVGNRMIEPKIKAMKLDTIFDIASLTKPVVVATLAMKLMEQKLLKLDKPIHHQMPKIRHREITPLHLLTHSAGYPMWCPIYLNASSTDEILTYLGTEIPLEYETGTQVIYSCLGYILLGEMIERITGIRLDKLAKKWIFDPLGMSETGYNPAAKFTDRCAATEHSNNLERHTTGAENYHWRSGIIVGEVHDENAHSLGGVSGNAGLFSTAIDLSKFCAMLLRGGEPILKGDSVKKIATSQTEKLNASRSIGWVVRSDGSLFHAGFTGTSIHLDFEKKSYEILLTNRVHPQIRKVPIDPFRRKFHKF